MRPLLLPVTDGRIDEAGFSLLELLVAMTVLTVMMLGAGLGAGRTLQINEYGRSVSVATTLAQDKLEALQSYVPTHPELTAGEHVSDANPLDASGRGGGIYRRTWEVQDDVPVAGVKTVTVHVRWTLQGTGHEVRIEGLHS